MAALSRARPKRQQHAQLPQLRMLPFMSVLCKEYSADVMYA